ncbi:MAG TPA: YicC/YloC family endoribonuclease [Bryobacteraceae bacterium]|nr:YicC/YloC family endoribonuclease [Bryobacteraceae bacterium]
MSAPIRSMTGFARVRESTAQGEITVSLKSVNHRGLDLHFHLPSAFDPFEAAIRAAVKRTVLRGHIDIRCSWTSAANSAAGGLNVPLFRAYLAAFRQAAAEEGLSAEPDLNRMFQHPGMFGATEEKEPDPALEGMIVSALDQALETLNAFRAREGAELASVIRAQNRVIQDCAAEIEKIRSQAMPAFQVRLQERLRELLANSPVDPQRLAQEAALLADRSDIAEEIARLKIHSKQLDEILDAGGEVGKKLDFLLQEMNRESNTILSKTGGIGELGLRITELALESKSCIEKIREQALNLE